MTTSAHTAEAISDAIVSRLETRTKALGAETDLGLKVYRGRRHVDDTMLPCCVLIEGDDLPSRESRRTEYKLDQRYVVFAYVPCDANDPNIAAHAAIRDLKRAIFTSAGKPDFRLGGLVRDVEYLGRDIGPRGDGAAFVLAAIEVAVEYVEDLASP